MDRRRQKIDEFLKLLANIAIYNPNMKITENIVYGELVRIGIERLDRDYQISSNFGYWIDRFRDKDNIEVFNSEKWKYFCQFANGGSFKERTYIKMYIPLNKENIVEGTNMIFDFMASNNIIHQSKICSALRNDSIVVRVASFKDANALANFVNSNAFIKNNLIEANPFMFNDGNIGYATDANLSYSDQISQYIASYISSLDRNQLTTVSIDNFANYIKKQYNDVFVRGNSQAILEYEKQHELSDLPFAKKIYTMANCNEVTKLIFCSLSEENRIDRVAQIYNELMNETKMKEIEDDLRNKYSQIKERENTVIVVDKEMILKKAIYLTFDKYGYEQAKKALIELANQNNSIGITREQGARDAVKKHLTGLDVKQIIEQALGSVNFDLYMNRILERKGKEHKETILENACIETLKKYGASQLEHAIKQAINGNFVSFTNTNGCRKELIKNINQGEIEILMQEMLFNSKMVAKNNIISDFIDLMQIKLQEYQTSEKNNITL